MVTTTTIGSRPRLPVGSRDPATRADLDHASYESGMTVSVSFKTPVPRL